MSDRIADLLESYQDAVNSEYPRSIGLFSIPEYPELETGEPVMWSAALEAIFTTLRYLAPATLLTLFWGQQSFLFKLLKHIDLAIRTVVFSSNEQKESVLQWLAESGPVRVEALDTVWRHGWILCDVLDAALPGTCAGHPPTRLTLKHAQTIAEHYLAVEAVFSDHELETNDCLSRHQEWKLAHYLDRIRQAMAKIPPAVSKPSSQRTSPEIMPFNLDYAARGSGLSSAQINNTMYFKIYPTTQQSLTPGEIKIEIKGPDNIHGIIVIPPILGKAQLIRKRILDVDRNKKYTENILPITQGATYLRNYGKNDMNKTYYIPKSKYDFNITVDCNMEYAKIGYTVSMEGKYEILINSHGQNILGSPFAMTASKNILKNLEKESFCLEDGEEIDIVDVTTDKKVVLRIVDFVTEKMLLREDGVLERISDEAAEILMTTRAKTCKVEDFTRSYSYSRFKEAAIKIVLMIRICKIFKDNAKPKRSCQYNNHSDDSQVHHQHQQDVPDLVNFTRHETNHSGCGHYKNQDNIKEKNYKKDNLYMNTNDIDNTIPRKTKDEPSPLIKICIDSEEITDGDDSKLKQSREPELIDKQCLEDIAQPKLIERPKTPVLKIITGNINDRCDSVYLDEQTELYEKILAANEFLNPFFIHQLNNKDRKNDKITDFIIGAPVSVKETVPSSISQTEMESILITNTETEESSDPEDSLEDKNNHNAIEIKENNPFYDFENTINHNKRIKDTAANQMVKSANKREIWDSAYVSIDENSSSPNSNSQSPTKLEQELISYDKWNKEIENMGPAEKELWESCTDIFPQQNTEDEIRHPRWSIRKNTFTPILEESDRSLSLSLKYETNEETENAKTDAVTEAFAELDEVFETYSYLPNENDANLHDTEINNEVKSASEISSDVMRLINTKQEGISEVQSNVTESVSVSQNLHTFSNKPKTTESNIVLEKKKFWDEKIRIIEEIKVEQQKKEKKIHSKQMKNNDSLSKRKGRQMLKNFLAASEKAHINETTSKRECTVNNEGQSSASEIKDRADAKLVEKWKKYWDEKLETEIVDHKYIYPKSKSLQESQKPTSQIIKKVLEPDHDNISQNSIQSYESEMEISKALRKIRLGSSTNIALKLENDHPFVETKSQGNVIINDNSELYKTKLENDAFVDTKSQSNVIINDNSELYKTKQSERKSVPEDVMFQAFETSPKRFFGTSRRQIMSKIDAFLGKTENSDKIDKDITISNKEKGIVTSRVCMFKNISHDKNITLLKEKSIEKINDQQVLETMNNENIVSKYKKNFSQQTHEHDLKYVSMPTYETKKSVTTTTMTHVDENHTNKTHETTERKTPENEDNKQINSNVKNSYISLKDRRNAFTNKCHSMTNSISSFEETKDSRNIIPQQSAPSHINDIGNLRTLRRSAFSKSELNLNIPFTTLNKDRCSEKYKSCDELPKSNVKNFIGLYETVSKNDKRKPMKTKIMSFSAAKSDPDNECTPGDYLKETERDTNASKVESIIAALNKKQIDATPNTPPRCKKSRTPSQDNRSKSQSVDSLEGSTQGLSQYQEYEDEPAYISISDIDIEIVEKNDETIDDTKPERDLPIFDYSSRFKNAKEYFKSLEELRVESKRKKANNSHQVIKKESPQTEKSKRTFKTRSWSSTELSRICDEEPNDSSKLMKISEKFHVDDLYNDVVEGKLSRQGSLRGIPNKKAVLETFKSMENVSHGVMSPYEIAVTQLNDFAKENSVRNAQTYLTEYPYLPTTDPSKYHSRLDIKASGLITMREINNQKRRRNSVPDRNNEFDNNL